MEWLTKPHTHVETDEPWHRHHKILAPPPDYLVGSYAADFPYDEITLLTIHTLVCSKLISHRHSDAWWTYAYEYHSSEVFEGEQTQELVFWMYDYVFRCLLTDYYIDPDEGLPVIVEFLLECYISNLPYSIEGDTPEAEEYLLIHSANKSYDYNPFTMDHRREFKRLYKMVMIYNTLGTDSTVSLEETQNLLYKGYHRPPHLWDGFKVNYLPDDQCVGHLVDSLPAGFKYYLREAHYTDTRWEFINDVVGDRDHYENLTTIEQDNLKSDLEIVSDEYPEGFSSKMLELLTVKEVYPEYFESDYHTDYIHLLQYIFPPNLFSKNYGVFRKDKTLAEVITDSDIDYYHPLLNDKVYEMSLSELNRRKRESREGTANLRGGKTQRVSASSARTMRSRTDKTLTNAARELGLSTAVASRVKDVVNDHIANMNFDMLSEYLACAELEVELLEAYLKETDADTHNGVQEEIQTGIPREKKMAKLNDRQEREERARNERRENYKAAFGYYPGEAPDSNANNPLSTASTNTVIISEGDQPVETKPNNAYETNDAEKEEPETSSVRESAMRRARIPARTTGGGTERKSRTQRTKEKRKRPESGFASLARASVPCDDFDTIETPETTTTFVLDDDKAVDVTELVENVELADTFVLGEETVTEEPEVPATEKADNSNTPDENGITPRHLENLSPYEILANLTASGAIVPRTHLISINNIPKEAYDYTDIDEAYQFYTIEQLEGTPVPKFNLVVQRQEGWMATFFHGGLANSIINAHRRINLENNTIAVTEEDVLIVYPWVLARQVLSPEVIRTSMRQLPAYNQHCSTLYVYFDAFGRMHFTVLAKSEEEMENYNKHQIDPAWADAEMDNQSFDITESTYVLGNARTINPLLEYDEKDVGGGIIATEAETVTLPTLTASDIHDARSKAERLVASRNYKSECQVVETVWDKKTSFALDAIEKEELLEWLSVYKDKGAEDPKVDIMDMFMTIPLPRTARTYFIKRCTEIYNELIRFNLAADYVVSDIVAEWPIIEDRIRYVEGDAWVIPLAKVNTQFYHTVLSLLNKLSIETVTEYMGAFEVTNDVVVFVESNSLTVLPWTVHSTGLNLVDLSNGISINGDAPELSPMRSGIESILKRVCGNHIIQCQLMTADGTVINVGMSVHASHAYVIYTK